MKFATYTDGNNKTTYGALLERYSTSCTVEIKPEHREQFISWLQDTFCDYDDETVGITFPTDRSKPVPVMFSADELGDQVLDMVEEELDWFAPYAEELIYMCHKDPCGMGIVYLMGDAT